jgi:undecaprenyl-diphosphatase
LVVAELAGGIGWPEPFELSNRSLASGALLVASYLRWREVAAEAAISDGAAPDTAARGTGMLPFSWSDLRRYVAALPRAIRGEWPGGASVFAFGAALVALATISVAAGVRDRFPGDLRLTQHVQDFDLPGLTTVMRAATDITSPANSLTALVVAVTAFLLLGRPRLAFFTAGALGAHALGGLLKVLVDRQRPDDELIARVRIEEEYSYPSGHVEWAVAFEGFVVFAIWQLTGSRVIRAASLSLWVAHVVLTSAGRIDQGLHWPSDVVASYLVGAVALAGLIWLYRVSGRLADQHA